LLVDPEIPKVVVTLFTNQLMAYENNEKYWVDFLLVQGWKGGYKLWRRRLNPLKLA
jgi:hypothetical protein